MSLQLSSVAVQVSKSLQRYPLETGDDWVGIMSIVAEKVGLINAGAARICTKTGIKLFPKS